MNRPSDIRPEFYNEEYYLQACGGHEVFRRSGGSELDVIRGRAMALADPRPGETVLDLGCGRGEMLIACALRGCRASGIDYSAAAAQIARRAVAGVPEIADRVLVEQMDLRRLQLPPAYFDVAFMLDVVEHIPQRELLEVMERIRDVIRPGGRLIVHTGPTLNFLRVGQHVKRILYRARGQEVPPLLTRVGELRTAGHCNLQSRRSLAQALAAFDESRIWYQFTEANGAMYRWAMRAGLTPFLAFNLWAIARRGTPIRNY